MAEDMVVIHAHRADWQAIQSVVAGAAVYNHALHGIFYRMTQDDTEFKTRFVNLTVCGDCWQRMNPNRQSYTIKRDEGDPEDICAWCDNKANPPIPVRMQIVWRLT